MHIVVATIIATLAASGAALDHSNGIGRAIPITKRSSLQNADTSTVDFDALKVHVAYVKAKIHHGLENYGRTTGKTHPAGVGGAKKRETGLPLTGFENALWYGNIAVGTPAKNLSVCFDTGSSDLWVSSVKCDKSCDGHRLWDPASSSTAIDLHLRAELGFGNGSTTSLCEQYRDTVSVSGFEATNQTLGAATSLSSQFAHSTFPTDGLLGMGFPPLAQFNGTPVFATLVNEKKVPKAQFSFKLASEGSELFIGGSNPKLYTGNFTFVNVTRKAFWEVKMKGLESNNKTLLKDVDVIIDTGTSLIIGEPSQVRTLYNMLGGNPVPGYEGFYSFTCDNFPNISLTFGNNSFQIPLSDLNIGHVSDGSNDCVSGIVGVDLSEPLWIIGDTFLRSVYTMFDMKRAVVGFAELASKSRTES